MKPIITASFDLIRVGQKINSREKHPQLIAGSGDKPPWSPSVEMSMGQARCAAIG
jgi:hypothetical protein